MRLQKQQLQEKKYLGVLSIMLYYQDELFEKRNRENIYEALATGSGQVEGNNIFIYTNKIEY